MLLPRNMSCFSARMWGASLVWGLPRRGALQAVVLEPSASAPTLMVLQGLGESRWAHRKEHSGVREMWRRERKQDGQEGQGGMWAGGIPGAEHHQRPERRRLH